MPAVFDTGPLIYLEVLGYLSLLEELYLVAIPGAVAEELSRYPGAPGSQAPTLESVERMDPGSKDMQRVAAEPPAVDAGEHEVIALAFGRGWTAVIDDRAGRSLARRLGMTGTLGVLAALHYADLARRTLVEDLGALDAAGMYLAADLKRRVMDRFRAGHPPQEGMS